MSRSTGRYEKSNVGREAVQAWVPDSLPPRRPALDLTGELGLRLRAAEFALAGLAAAAALVPSVTWFVYAFVRKEAVLSSQIEGTQASLDDLLAVEANTPAMASADHVEEICNYLDALHYARAQLARATGLPLSVRLLNGAHKRLMAGVRGRDKQPGRLRKSQNWIGGTRPGNAAFVPPPPHRVPELLGDLEHWLHREDGLPPLLRVGLIHVQFETIHPYLDGNGRIGRLLIALCLEHWRLLPEPLLYLSLYFKRHRSEYYRRLDSVRSDGDWEGWLCYFLEGVEVIARESVVVIGTLFELVALDRSRYLDSDGVTLVGVRLFDLLPEHPVLTIKSVVELCGTTKPTASKAVESLSESGILVEVSGRSRDRVYQYASYLDILRAGTEL